MEQVPLGIPEQVRTYLFRQLTRLETLIATDQGTVGLTSMPHKPIKNKLYYFRNAVSPDIANEGFWWYNGTNWLQFVTSTNSITLPVSPAIYAPSFSANWSNFGSGGYSDVQYFKTLENIVYVYGLCKKSVATTALETILTLPAGFRPANRLVFNSFYTSGATRIDIDASGNIIYVAAGHTISFLSLSGISFLAA